jgi:hypothetical protein
MDGVGRWASRMAIAVGIIVGSDLGNVEGFRILKVQARGDSRFKNYVA